MNRLLLEGFDFILKKGKTDTEQIMTLNKLISLKQPTLIMDLLNEMANNVKSKTFPVGKEEEYIYLQVWLLKSCLSYFFSILWTRKCMRICT
jgi:hypothetical protein